MPAIVTSGTLLETEELVVDELSGEEEAGTEELVSDELVAFPPPQEASSKEPAKTNKKDRRVVGFMRYKSFLSGIMMNKMVILSILIFLEIKLIS